MSGPPDFIEDDVAGLSALVQRNARRITDLEIVLAVSGLALLGMIAGLAFEIFKLRQAVFW